MKKIKKECYGTIYTEVYKEKIVQLYNEGKKKIDISKKYDVSMYLLNKWIKQSYIK